MTTHHHDQLPKQRTAPQPEQETPPAWRPETEPTVDPRTPAPARRRGKLAMTLAGVLTVGGGLGWAGMSMLDNDASAKGPQPDRPAASASEVPGTQTEKAPEMKLSELTAETMPFYGPDGKKFEGMDEVQAYLNNISMTEFPTRHAAAEEFVDRLGYVTAMGITPEAVNVYSEANDIQGSQYAPQTEAELRTGAMDQLFDNTFTAPKQNMQQNRDELEAFTKNTHNAVIATANDMFEGHPNNKPFKEWQPFTIINSERNGDEGEGGESTIVLEHTFIAPGRDGKYVFSMDMAPRDADNWGVSSFNLQEMPESWSPNN